MPRLPLRIPPWAGPRSPGLQQRLPASAPSVRGETLGSAKQRAGELPEARPLGSEVTRGPDCGLSIHKGWEQGWKGHDLCQQTPATTALLGFKGS